MFYFYNTNYNLRRLITHFNNSQNPNISNSSSNNQTSYLNKPTKVVGDMVFDPIKMCWLTNNDDDDVFANLSSSSTSSNECSNNFKFNNSILSDTISNANNNENTNETLYSNISKSFIDICYSTESLHDNQVRSWVPRGGLIDDRRYLYEIYVMSKRIANKNNR